MFENFKNSNDNNDEAFLIRIEMDTSRLANSFNRKVFVTGLPVDANITEHEIKSELESLFGPCGVIKNMKLSLQNAYGQQKPKRTATMEFENCESFNRALGLDGSFIKKKFIRVYEFKDLNRGSNSGGSSSSGGRSNYSGDSSGRSYYSGGSGGRNNRGSRSYYSGDSSGSS